MKYLLIPLLCCLAVSKVTLQSNYSKSKQMGLTDNIFFNMMMFAVVGIFFSPWLIFGNVPLDTYFFGAITGVLSVCFQLTYLFAFSKGKPVLVTTLNNFSMFIPIAVSCLIFGEPFGISRLVALILATASILLITLKKDDGKSNNPSSNLWILFTFFAFLANGLLTANQKVYANLASDFNVFGFVASSYVTATILSLIVFIVILKKSDEKFEFNKKALISAGGSGLFLGLFQCVNTYAASVIDGAILYSAYNCGSTVLFALVRIVFFGEKLSKRQLAGVFLGVCSIFFM